SQLAGAREMAARILGKQIRIGRPHGLRGLPEAASGPAFATAAGLLAWAAGAGQTMQDIDLTPEASRGVVGRIIDFFRQRV
ncbi:MAG TPA: cell division protein FtsA, partial [Acetobacteraceae bacterium]|nr:cell division protein FtsA [Acetobacteraceae bacterium]